MRMNRNLLSLLAVGGLAFGAGHLLSEYKPLALAGEQTDHEMNSADNRKTPHSDSAKTAKIGFVSFGTTHWALSAKKSAALTEKPCPQHHRRRLRQPRRV